MLRPLIQAVFAESKERFGANKIRIKLAGQGIKVSAEHIRRLMNEMGLIAKQARLRCFNSTNRKYMYRRNRVQQNFNQTAPNLLWVSDVTYARINQDFYAICVVIDVFSRKVLSYRISDKNDTALVLTAFKTAFTVRNNPQGVTFHSDQGLQYSSYKFRKHLRDCGVIQSFSNPGTPYDNAVAESFFSIMKREELSHNYYHSFEELEKTVSEYIDFFNRMRPHQKMGNLTPNEIECRYYEN
ncbi:MAG: IS3 family transposase [Lentisphaerae bacterium]|nr:IS3 family transposase [Lentisphaerota bacterium]